MARDGRLIHLKEIREKVEKQAGRKISELQLLVALDDPDLIDLLARRVQTLGLRHQAGFSINIDGWTVRKGSDGYYRIYKTVDGKTESIYLGKRLNCDKARRKITKKEKKLGLSFS
jgi:hypothetical protein